MPIGRYPLGWLCISMFLSPSWRLNAGWTLRSINETPHDSGKKPWVLPGVAASEQMSAALGGIAGRN